MSDSLTTRPDGPSPALKQAADILDHRAREMVEEYKERLRASNSPLLADEETRQQLWAQAMNVCADAAKILRGSSREPAEEDALSKRIGSQRARMRVVPGESLRAAVELSEAALSVVLKEISGSISQAEVAAVAMAIQRGMVGRIARAMASYVDYLFERVEESRAEERRRMSRELHDRVAHSMAVVYRSVDLYKALRERDPGRAEDKLTLIREMAQDALASAREISVELRRSVAEEGLEVALSDLLPMIVPADVKSSISVRGEESLIPSYVREDLFLILREALRNAVMHSGATEIKVSLLTDRCSIRAAVGDNGRGFEPGSETFAVGTGIRSMEERVDALCGSLNVRSAPAKGTRVEVRVPLARRA